MLQPLRRLGRRLRHLGLALLILVCMGAPAAALPLLDLLHQLPLPLPGAPSATEVARPAAIPSEQAAQGIIQGTSLAPDISGSVVLIERVDGLHMIGAASRISPGPHGFHIHEGDSCAEDAQAAGRHFNPGQTPHGLMLTQGLEQAHAGDLGNLEVAPTGQVQWQAFLPGLSLGDGPYSVANRTVILHAQPDDFSQPSGNAGARIACGVLRLVPSPRQISQP